MGTGSLMLLRSCFCKRICLSVSSVKLLISRIDYIKFDLLSFWTLTVLLNFPKHLDQTTKLPIIINWKQHISRLPRSPGHTVGFVPLSHVRIFYQYGLGIRVSEPVHLRDEIRILSQRRAFFFVVKLL